MKDTNLPHPVIARRPKADAAIRSLSHRVLRIATGLRPHNDGKKRNTDCHAASQLQSVLFYIKEGTGTAGAPAYLYSLTSSFTETQTTWNATSGCTGQLYDTETLVNNVFAEFDITMLAQSWKTGSTNSNGMFVLMGDETTQVDKAVYSSEFGTTDRRPYVVVNYVLPNSVVNVNESSTTTLSLSDISGTITWASDNTTVATVNSSGVVTGVKAGTANITATADGMVQKTYIVYVTLADGVYTLSNVAASIRMGAKDASIAENTRVVLQNTFTSTPGNLRQLWKITYLGNGYYSIRPMHKLSMGLYAFAPFALIREIGTSDTSNSVPNAAQWKIFYNSSGYVIQNRNLTNHVLMPYNGATTADTEIHVEEYSSSNSSQRWSFSSVTAPVGVLLYDTETNLHTTILTKKYVALGETLSLDDLGLIPTVYAGYDISYDFVWRSGTPSVVSVNSITGAVKGLSIGESTMTLIASLNDGEFTYEITYDLMVIPIASDIYYIKNPASGFLLDSMSTAPSSGTAVLQKEFETAASLRNRQKWEITHLGNSIYSIKTTTSDGTDYYLSVSGEPTDSNVTVELKSGSLTYDMRWELNLTSSGRISLKPRSWSATSYVLGAEDPVLGSSDEIGPFTFNDEDLDYRDEWILSKTAYEYLSYYDTSFPTARAADIPSVISTVNNIFNHHFGITFTSVGNTIYDNNTLADQCSTGTHSGCTDASCGSDCETMHHKNIYRISDQMYYRRQNQRQVVVLWADRNAGTYCSHLDADHPNDDTEHYCTYLACVCYKRQVVHIMDPVTHDEGNAEQYRAFMAITLAHETAHSLGCSEAYETAGHETSIWSCVMNKFATSPTELLVFYNQLNSNNPKAFCSTCITELSGSIPSEGIS